MRLFQLEPNFTAILPGRCQARCPFCVEPEAPSPATAEQWLASLRSLLNGELPAVFRCLSISGGEPSLSPAFPGLLTLLAEQRSSRRFARVVLTTNGCPDGILAQMDAIAAAVTQVNISRHAVDDSVNAGIFRSGDIPSRYMLSKLIAKLNRRGLPVNLNCVYSPHHAFGKRIGAMDATRLRAAADEFISMAKDVGASSVVFRYDHRETFNDRPSWLEVLFSDYADIHEASCPSCHIVCKFVRGLPTYFKRSAYEPTADHAGIYLYELVMHGDGGLYLDWSRLRPVQRPLPPSEPTEDWHRLKRADTTPILDFAEECADRQDTCTLLLFHRTDT
jgi:pyruvate-formate lyase-activating enzyme